jgi:hypothetical protein
MSDQKINSSQILLDISRGYSVLKNKQDVFYFKHPSNLESLKEQEYYDITYQRAIKRGIYSESKLLERYIKGGQWSLEKEEKIKSLKWMIDKSTKASLQITDDFQRKVFTENIENQRKELQELESDKNKLIGQSAESWARQQRMFKTVEDHIFQDLEFKHRAEIGNDAVLVISMQKKIIELSTKNNLLAAAYDSVFFDVFSLQYRQPMSIFGVDFFTITVFQRYLLSYASVLLNKLRNIDMPDEVRSDPLKIFEFNPDAKSQQSKVTHGVDDLKNALKNKGKITAEDLIK